MTMSSKRLQPLSEPLIIVLTSAAFLVAFMVLSSVLVSQ